MTHAKAGTKGQTFSQERAVKEVEKNYRSVGEFFYQMGKCKQYKASDVLAWISGE